MAADVTLHVAMLFVADFDRMTAFYREGLGLTPVPERSTEGWTVFDAGGAHFALHAIPPAIARDIARQNPPEPRTTAPIKLVFNTRNLDAVMARLAKLGVTLHPGPVTNSFEGLDPEGNIFQLIVST